MKKHSCLCAVIFLIASGPTFAYIGPGMGGGVIAAVIGVIGSIFLALFGVLYYPIKRALKNKKKKRNDEEPDDQKQEAQDSP